MQGFFKPSEWDTPTKRRKNLPSCGECGLSKQCLSPKMEPTGKGKHKILFVIGAAAEEDDRQGKHLVGPVGEILRDSLESIGEELNDAHMTSAVICRPPNNKITDQHIEFCRPNIIKTVKKLKPNVIIPLGIDAIKSVIGTEWMDKLDALQRWLGWTIPSKTFDAWICPTFDPFVLKKLNDVICTKLFKQHLKAAYKLEKKRPTYLDVKDLEKEIEVIKKPRLGRLRLRELAKREGILAFDYETTGLKPEREEQEIVSCSFCLNGTDTFAVLMHESYRKYMRMILRKKKLLKVASNAKFEIRWSHKKFGVKVGGWYWDTMLAAHYLDNRKKITSVKFQSYILFGVNDYNTHIKPYLEAPNPNDLNRIHELDKDDLLIYNGLDSLLEYKVMEAQRDTLLTKRK